MPPQTILVADDDPTVSSLVSAALQKEGYRVVAAMDAMQAVRVSFKSAPDAIVLDIQMPGGTGLDVLKKIKASSLTRLIPVIAISSLSDPALPDLVRALGAAEFLPKPVDLDRLRAELKRLLKPPDSPAS